MTARTGMRGFSLIELIAVIVLLAAGLVVLLQVFGTATRTIGNNVDGLLGAQLAQERAERLLADRRNSNPALGFNSPSLAVGTVNESPVAGFPNYSRTTVITVLAPSPALPAPQTSPCPSGANCRQVVVSVSRAALLVGQVTLMVADY